MTLTIRLLKNHLTLVSLLLLTGCSLLSPVANQPPSKYLLNKLPPGIANNRMHGSTLMVAVPESSTVYNTTQMAYSRKPFQVEYFSQNEWADTPPLMLQPLLVQTIENTHFFHAVVTPPSLNHYEYTLNTQLLTFHEDLLTRMPRFLMTVRVQLSRTTTNNVIATKEFSVAESIPQGTPYGGVIAANRASEKILGEIARFCVQKL